MLPTANGEPLKDIAGFPFGSAEHAAQALDGTVDIASQLVKGGWRNALQDGVARKRRALGDPPEIRTNLSLSKVSAAILALTSDGSGGNARLYRQEHLDGVEWVARVCAFLGGKHADVGHLSRDRSRILDLRAQG